MEAKASSGAANDDAIELSDDSAAGPYYY